MENKDYYKILEIERDATDKDIRNAYRRLSKLYHPDRNNGSKEAEEKFKEVAEAYRVLSDKDLRQRYDTFGTVEGMGFDSGMNMSPDEMFASFMKRHGFGFDDEPQERIYKGRDKILKINVTFEEVYKGVTKDISYSVNRSCDKCHGSGSKSGRVEDCPHCHGTGQVHNRQQFGMMITDNITPCPYCGGTGKMVKDKCPNCNGTGVIEGKDTLRIKVPTIDKVLQQTFIHKGGGHACENGLGINGDLRFTFNLVGGDGYDIDMNNVLNIVKKVKVPVIDCLLGTTLSISHFDGKTYNITLAECTPNGKLYKINGKGFKVGNYVGDLLIKIEQIMPDKLTDEQRKILNKLKKK